jgi:hypothetical protein
MAARFISLRTSPILKLVSRGLIFGLSAFLLISDQGKFWLSLAFIAVAVIMYFRPALRSLTFSASFIALVLLPFLLPPLPISPFIIAGLMGMSFTVLSGVKNLELIDRKGWYTFVHFSILASYGAIVIYNNFSLLSEIFGFMLFLFLFHEFYRKMGPLRGDRLLLAAGIMSLLSLELLGVLVLLPIGFVAGAALFTLIVYALFNTYSNQLNGRFSAVLLLRNVTLLTLSSLLVMVLSSWTLY